MKNIKLLSKWGSFEPGNVIEESYGVAEALIKCGRAVPWNGKNLKLVKNRVHNKKVKDLNNK